MSTIPTTPSKIIIKDQILSIDKPDPNQNYIWYRDGIEIKTADGKNVAGVSYKFTPQDIGKKITASYSDGSGRTATLLILDLVTSLPKPEIVLTAKQGSVLTATINYIKDIAATKPNFTYQWYRGDRVITGETNSSYTLTAEDTQKNIYVSVNYKDSKNTSKTVISPHINAYGDISLNGIAQQNKILTISNPIATEKYIWYQNGEEIKTAEGKVFENISYTLTQKDVGKNITVSYEDGTYKTAPLRIANLNDSPTGTVNVLGIFKQGFELTADVQIIDVDVIGTDEKGNKIYNYQWLRDGTNIKGATSDKYKLTVDDVQKTISVKVTYIDLQNTLETVLSSGVAISENKATDNHLHTGMVEIKGIAQENKLLTVIDTLADVDGLGTVTYHWLRYGLDDTIEKSVTGSSYLLMQEDVGKNISLYATYTDRSGYTEKTDETSVLRVTNVNNSPTGTLSIIVNGELPNAQKAAQKDTLKVKNTLNDTDGIGTDKDGKFIFNYQWLSNGAAIAGETGEMHILTQADVNKIISVKSSYIDLQGKKEDIISAGLSIDNVNDSPTGSVYIIGVPNLGRTLSAAPQLIDLDGLGEISYQWFRNDVEIQNATQVNYALTKADLDMQMSVKVAYTDGFGNQETASSQKMPLAVSTSTKMTIGSDYITGTSKAEKITGLSGDDTLIGGLGNDTLTGGLGNDVFLFNTEKEMNKDTIVDFKTGQDKIDISNMDGDMKTAGKQGFTFIGNDVPFVKNDAIGKLRFDSQKHILYGSNDADIQPEFSIVLTGVDSLESSDFIFKPAS